ncbi:NF-kappa-B inhibitor zeta [Platysternon megacephalum]|uniref:NF-kappa-B inhibitor zeta n=1 Tax=Platysternon megacephalum TaxID=55544 RepID=A0A4D9DPY5_9SAUR|nr:NF-kappa-B inhibitor zeta [Platysternon megacephalum]
MVEMLQKIRMSPEILTNQNISESEIGGYSRGQGSPLPGETASPKSYSQQSPSLPASGLTEFNVVSPKSCHIPPVKTQEMSALTDSTLSTFPPQKQYVGVRVKMPVRELLRKVRLSKGMDPSDIKVRISFGLEKSPHMKVRKARPYTEKQFRQKKQSSEQALKGLEDLDILVEVLEEDLNKSHSKLESLSPLPACCWHSFSPDIQAPWWEANSSKQPAGSLLERSQNLTKLQLCCPFADCNPLLCGQEENSYLSDYKKMQHPGSLEISFPSKSEEQNSWQMQDAFINPQRHFPGPSAQDKPFCYNPPGHHPEEFLEVDATSRDYVGHLKSTSVSSEQQDLSALSFFQFQLYWEESLLRNIPVDKLLAPDENGNRLLHKAVTQGRRALTYALAQRFASLNKIDEKDAAKRTALHLAAEKNQHLMVNDLISLGANVNEQDSLGKTPLHLCAKNGYLRVLDVLKKCKEGGMHVEVDLTDHYGLTPLHCAVLAHTALVRESQKVTNHSDMRKFLQLREDKILEGINCLLQMGANSGLQKPKSCQTATHFLKIQENKEMMCFLQSHGPKREDVLQEDCGLPNVLSGGTLPYLQEMSELFSSSSSNVFGNVLKACLAVPGICNFFKTMRIVKMESTVQEENRISQSVQQLSDAHCPCAPGYKTLVDGRRHCVRQVYDICRDATSRNQEGQCLTKKEWMHYCTNKVCARPEDYQGYDKVLGLCVCRADNLNSVCNSQCRRQQRDILQFVCKGKNAQLSLTYRNGSQIAIFLEQLKAVLQVLHSPAKNPCPTEHSTSSYPVYMVKTSGKGFLGVYNPDPELLHNLIVPNKISSPDKSVPLSAAAPGKTGKEDQFYWAQSQKPSNSTLQITFTGILNPTTCINGKVTIIFIVSKEHYPVYDVNNLYNTNNEFDWGGFRSLAEEIKLASTNILLFLFQFKHPGTYVLGLSSNQHKKMLLCQDLAWSKEGTTCPLFRRLQLKYNLDKYSSKGSTVISVKKCHPMLKNKDSLDKNYGNSDETEAFFLETGEIWESEEQINLDSFNTNVFFEILLTQSLSVTAKLSQFKEELKILYHKLMTEIASLRELCIMRLCIPEKAESYDSIMMGNYMKAKYQAEEEMLHRKQLAAEYDEIVNKQLHLLHHDLKCQEEHCVLFKSALREAMRLAEVLTEKMACGGNRAMWSKPDYQRLLAQIDAASNRMSSAVLKESHRLKAWGVLGDGTGAHLINKDKTRLLTKEELLDSDGCVRAPDTLYMDPITGLLTPNPDCVMLLVNHCPMPVSRDQFLHPKTGKVLPVAGNVGYDPVSSKLISAVDSASGELCKSEVPIFPYVPYPISPMTGLPVKTKLPSLQPDRVFKLGGLMLDPATEIEVPVLGVTIHPQTGQKLSLGGTYMNPLTGTVTPLEIGGPMIEPEGGKIVPILGVSLDNNTGDLVPVGGLMGPSGSLLLLGDSFSEPLSRKTARIHGACLKQDKVLPHAGGYQALLEANTLVAQIHVVEALRQYKDSICEDMSLAADKQEVLKAAVEDMKKSLSIRLHHAIHRLRSLEKQHEIASSLKSNGGKLGIIKYPGTEMWIPAVFGMKVPDPGGSDLMVPILGVECDWNTGHPTPLAGTMEDADGKGLVPITVGARTIDPITGETGPVIGAQTDPWTNIVIPIVQSLGALPRGAADPDLLSILEKEINSRQMYWHRQREREEELLKELNFVFLDVLDAVKEGKAQKIRYKDKLKDIEETCHCLEESSLQEAQRRTARDLSSLLGSELSLLSKAERDEKEQEVRVILVIRKALEKMVQFIQKMQLEEGRLQRQMKEKAWQRSKNFNAETALRFKPRKVILHHVAEFQEHIMKQQVSVESAYSRLEYLRDLLDIQALQAKALLSGKSQCFENYKGTRFYGIAGVPHGTWAVIRRKLIPLLKSLVQTLEENKRSDRSLETLILQSGYSSRSTLKVSTAQSEAFRTAASQEIAPAATLSPVLPSFFLPGGTHIQQEILTRFFLEKHASELVHLELSLMTEEINMICYFYESAKAKEKEECKENWGMKSRKEMDVASDWNTFLKELAEYHQRAEQALYQKHWEEIKQSGLSRDLVTPKDHLRSLDEILHHLSLLGADLQITDSHIKYYVTKKQDETQSLEAELAPDSATQILQASAAKIVKLEVMKQVCVYRILDLYNELQRQTCPEGVLRILNTLHYRATGETVAQEVAQITEEQQVERAVAFLQKHHKEGDLLIGLKEESETELRNMQTQFRLELQTQTEEMMQAKEMQVIQEAERQELPNRIEHVAYFILSQRHLRQTVIVLQDSCRFQKADLWTQTEERNLCELVIDGSLVDDDMKGILHLLKDNMEYKLSGLELKQAARLLQLREKQFLEITKCLKDHSLDKSVDEAGFTANDLQEFRKQKIRGLKEQLKIFMGDKRTKENTSSNPDPLQKMMKEHNETVAFLQKAFHQDLEKLRRRLEPAEKKKEKQQENSPPSSAAASSSAKEKPSQTEDQVLSLLAENVKILKQTEQLLASRIILLNPQFRSPVLYDDKAKYMKSSPLLTLLKDVNDQLQAHAMAVGLLESHLQEKDTGSSFQDILDALMTHKGELIPVHPPTLSAREFVIYQYGISILQFLRPHINAPEINLCVASSIPLSNTTGNAFQNSFFYQISENKLFILREYLGCVGSFILLLVHCLAHITAADLSHDSSPAFQRLFYQALKACLSEMFSLRLRMSAVLHDNKSSVKISEILLKGEPFSEEKLNLISQLFDAKVKSAREMEVSEERNRNLLLHTNLEDLLKNKLSVKKKECFTHTSAGRKENNFGARTSSEEESCSYFSLSEVEDQLDTLTEELVKVMEEEHHFLKYAASEDLLFDHLKIIGLKKDCLVKQMEILEGKIAKGREVFK